MQALACVFLPCQTREANPQSHLSLSEVPRPIILKAWPEDPETMEPIPWLHMGRKPSQQLYLSVLSQWHLLTSEFEQWPHPKIDPDSKLYLPKDINLLTYPEFQTELNSN